jgi:hypothetical protein
MMLLGWMILSSFQDAPAVFLAHANMPRVCKEGRILAHTVVLSICFLGVIGVATMSMIATMILLFQQLQQMAIMMER